MGRTPEDVRADLLRAADDHALCEQLASSNIRSVYAYLGSLWPWADLNECFERGIRVSDVDGVVECGRKLLWLEAKKPGTAIPYGQACVHQVLLDQGDTVLVIYGRHGDPESFVMRSQALAAPIDGTGLDELRRCVRQWFSWANSGDAR